MLELKNITKDYVAGENVVHALKGISLTLRDNEFVAILGPSGCGKTTTLNIVGGLDRYTEGDLLIEGETTKNFKDKDWDAYRNHKVGFVFQSYNLIPHQTVLSNVELALTIGGIQKEERAALAMEALTKVGLKDEVNKLPRQLSGGQMQRVAIARAIVNHPQVLLADEPTGALDSVTSVQVLDILKDLSKDCLIVMVTHNEDLAYKYATRIVTLSDGLMTSDSNPYEPSESERLKSIQKETEKRKKYLDKKGKMKKVGMPFFTAFKLSLANLRSKIGRTLLTCFAGSIGIIGIALVLSVSNGFNSYVGQVESSALSRYPLKISSSTVDVTALFTTFIQANRQKNSTQTGPVDRSYVIPNYVMVQLLETIANTSRYNDLKSFREYLEANRAALDDYVLHISYDYDVTINAYDGSRHDSDGNFVVRQLEPFTLPESDNGKDYYVYASNYNKTFMENFMRQLTVWSEIYNDSNSVVSDTVKGQYDLVAGNWPTSANEVVFVVGSDKEVADFYLYAAGLTDDENGVDVGDDYVLQMFHYVNKDKDENGNYITNPADDPKYKELFKWTYDKIMEASYYVVPEALYYSSDGENLQGIETFSSIKKDDAKMKALFEDPNSGVINVKVSGVVMPNEKSDTHSIDGAIGYTSLLTDQIIACNNESKIVTYQQDHTDYCLSDIAGLAYSTKGQKWSDIQATLKALQASGMSISDSVIDMMDPETASKRMLKTYGYVDKSDPTSISIYPKSFKDKDAIVEFINTYNAGKSDAEKISYNDYVAQIMGSVTTIIDAITYVLIAFVSISLVVSSIMIAIITYISVLERTKEIGILRAMGASKTDVKNIFNAETFITGLVAGILGIGITLILNIPISLIIKGLAGIENIANLPWLGGIILVVVSFFLSVISGLIPSSYAAKCDPVVALRSE